MKSSRSITLFALLACLIVSSPAFALDTGGPSLPPPIFDPCVGATFTVDMGTITDYDWSFGPGYYTSVYTYDVFDASRRRVAHVITHYKRVNFGSEPNVAMDDTFIDLVHGMTVFGHSVNRNAYGVYGIEGVITGAVMFNGDPVNMKGTYITTTFGGSPHFCVYFQ